MATGSEKQGGVHFALTVMPRSDDIYRKTDFLRMPGKGLISVIQR